MTYPIDGTKLVLDLKYSDLRLPLYRTTIHNHANLSAENDPNIGIVPVSSACLKSEGRRIASESERTLYAHMLMKIVTQFRVGLWINK